MSGEILTEWKMAAVDVTQLQQTTSASSTSGNGSTPTVYSGSFVTPPSRPNMAFPLDSYISTPGWFKGQIWINQFNLGRYWPAAGPQMTLYVPKTALRQFPFRNEILMLEYENAPCSAKGGCVVEFTTTPVLNGTVHPDAQQRFRAERAHGHQ